ncbi:hypothetical protein [Roseovarius spongiae]|uniref:hypothetical protein n=1 Tax=Roseovarius spongiae TaxID=2320272 RepID=UPI0011C4A1B1|nr:hypothetical protein [Roseovarius spongiae]
MSQEFRHLTQKPGHLTQEFREMTQKLRGMTQKFRGHAAPGFSVGGASHPPFSGPGNGAAFPRSG